MTEPMISIVVAVKNGARTLQRCIDSLRSQTYRHRELIVVDARSTDGTTEILDRNADAIAWRVSESDTGIYQAWNKGLRHVQGDWICFLGADDYFWDSSALEAVAPQLRGASPGARIVYGQVALVNSAGHMLAIFGRPWPEMRHAVLAGDALNIHQATFHHKSLFGDYSYFDESFQIAGDYEFLIRELPKENALYIPRLVAAMEHGGISSNPVTKVETIREIMRAMAMHGLKPGIDLRVASARAVVHAGLYRVVGPRMSAAIADSYRRLVRKQPLWQGSVGKRVNDRDADEAKR
jgi:glycosyltransferase involved in cell wall biosynthesis